MNSMIPTQANGVSTNENKSSAMTFVPRFDIGESSEEIMLWGDMPGVTQESLNVHCEKGELVIHGRVPAPHADKRFRQGEYGIGDYYRAFPIAETMDVDNISAELKNGVLSVRLPKRASAKPRRIWVKSA
jgi:HSP20 family protein